MDAESFGIGLDIATEQYHSWPMQQENIMCAVLLRTCIACLDLSLIGVNVNKYSE
jgi:hypothetical protein